MKKRSSKLIWVLIWVIMLVPIIQAEITQSISSIGYENIIYDGKNYTHIWNKGEIKQDYYYKGNCNSQISNNLGEQWEKVTLGMTYGDSIQEKIDNYVELHSSSGCSKIEDSGEDFINLTVWKPVSYLGKSGILAKNSYIETYDNYMKETFYFKAIDEINQDVWFVLKRDNINISNSSDNDFLIVYNKSFYPTNINLSYIDANNLTYYKNQDEINSGFFLEDIKTGGNIIFYANTTRDYYYIINDNSLYLVFKAGEFEAGQSKYLKTFWVDKGEAGGGGDSCLPGSSITGVSISIPDTDIDVGADYNFSLRVDINGACSLIGKMEWRDNTTGSYLIIPISDTDQDCDGAVCNKIAPTPQRWFSKNITCKSAGTYSDRGNYLSNPYGSFNSNVVNVNCNAPTPTGISRPLKIVPNTLPYPNFNLFNSSNPNNHLTIHICNGNYPIIQLNKTLNMTIFPYNNRYLSLKLNNT